MEITNSDQCFQLKVLGPDGSLDGGLQWLTVAIAVRVEQKTFRASGPWLTTAERSELGRFLSAAAQKCPGKIEFIEPNLAFAYEPAAARLTICLALEAKPPWLLTGELSFALDNEELARAAHQINQGSKSTTDSDGP